MIGFLFLLARNFEPLKTINEMYPAPWYLLMLVSFISGAVGFSLAFREGRIIRRGKRRVRARKISDFG